jgi:hypothetical protein
MTSFFTTTAKSAKGKLALTLLGVVAVVAASAFAVYAATKKPDFKIVVTPASKTVVKGSAATFDLKVTPVRKFRAPLSLTVTGLPSGATPTWQLPDGRSLPRKRRGGPSVLPKGKKKAKLFVGTTDATPTGTYTVKVTGAGGGKKHSKKVKLTVAPVPTQGGGNNGGGTPGPGTTPPAEPEPQPQPTPSVAIVASPATHNILPGEKVSYDLDITRSNFSGSVNLSVSGLPPEADPTFTPANPVSGAEATLDVEIPAADTPTPGDYDLTITADGGSGVSGQAATELVVLEGGSFQMSNLAPAAFIPGATRAVELTFTNPNDFDIQVTNVQTTLASTSDPTNCPVADNFSIVDQYDGQAPLTIPANANAVTLTTLGVTDTDEWPQVQMLNTTSNQDGCKGVSVNLGFAGDGTR